MRNLNERLDDPEEALRVALGGLQARMWTALPGVVESFDPDALTCSVQPTIQGTWTKPDGKVLSINMPLLVDCPVVFPSGGGVSLTFPLAAGDEVLVIFGSRCIDGWWQSGGVQPQAARRMHDLSDGMVIPGPKSQPRRSRASVTAAELRTDDGALAVRLHPASGVLTLLAPGGVDVAGDLRVSGTVTAVGEVTSAAVSLHHHVHVGVEPGAGMSGEPAEG